MFLVGADTSLGQSLLFERELPIGGTVALQLTAGKLAMEPLLAQMLIRITTLQPCTKVQ